MGRGVRDFFFVLIAAVLLTLPYHWGELGFLAFFAFIPYFKALEGRSSASAFSISFFLGLFFFAGIGYWLTYVNILGFILLTLYLAVYFGVFGWLSAKFLNGGVRGCFYIAGFWVVLEWVRGWMISGLPWALLAYSQWKNLLLIQIADLTGPYGVSYFVVLTGLLLYTAVIAASKNRSARPALTALAVVWVLVAGYGHLVLKGRDAFYISGLPKATYRVSVLQGNIPQEKKWDARIKNIIFEKYKRLMLMSAIERSDLIVWPETSFPGFLEDEPVMAAHLRNAIRQSRTEVVVGAPTMGNLEEEGLRFFNSAVHYDASGEEKKRYHKLHLVPFGEYVPFESIIGFIRNLFPIGHFSPGEDPVVFETRTRYQTPNFRARFSVLICYEDIFPDLVREFCRRGPDFLVNMTNDAWFGKTSAPYQHAQASVFRAVENRIPVIRATNTGYSCFISPEGRILGQVEDKGESIFVTGHAGHDLVLRKGRSFYTRFGDVFLGGVFVLCVFAYRSRNRHTPYYRPS